MDQSCNRIIFNKFNFSEFNTLKSLLKIYIHINSCYSISSANENNRSWSVWKDEFLINYQNFTVESLILFGAPSLNIIQIYNKAEIQLL